MATHVRTAVMTRRLLLGSMLLVIMASGFAGEPATAQYLVEAPAAQSPHWSHITIADFGRGIPYMGDAAARNTAYDWFTSHVDIAEAHGNVSDYTSRNPAMKMWVYQLDLYTFQTPEAVSLPENYFLHFSEDTQLTFYSLQRNVVGTVTIPGCPAPSPVTINCRVQFYIWTDKGWIFNLADPQFQAWKAQSLLTNVGQTPQGVFLDAHGPGFTRSHSWGQQTVASSGGGIREYDGRRPGADVDAAYNAAMVQWLTSLDTQFKQAGKFVIVNTAGYMLDQLSIDQYTAGRGLDTEFMHRPDAWAGSYQYEQFLGVAKNLVANGGVIDLHGTWCYQGPSGYTAGNYASPVGRYRMWRLASYYQLKEPVGSPGKVYFNTAFCSNATIRPQDDPTEWLPAYQVNIGQPSGETITHMTGTAGTGSSNGRACPYTIFSRTYTKAMVFVRTRDYWDCTDYTDNAGVMVTLPSEGALLREDGSLGPQVTSFMLRNGEAAIAYMPSGTTGSSPDPTATNSSVIVPTVTSPTPSAPSTSVTTPSSKPTPPETSKGFFGNLKNLMEKVR